MPGALPFRARPPRRRLGAVLFLVPLALLAACAPNEAYRTRFEAGRENRVELLTLFHGIRFASGEAELAAEEKARLDSFLGRAGALGYHRIFLRPAPQLVAPRSPAEALSARRRAAVTAYLKERRIAASPMPPSVPPLLPGDFEQVVAGRYAVLSPRECPDWSKSPTWDPENTVASNFGCAAAVNRGLMAADPGDLATGRPLAPAVGKTEASAVNRYRKGEVTPLEEAEKLGTTTE